MPFPSLRASHDGERPWNVLRAAAYGAAIGAVAAALKLSSPWSVPHLAGAAAREFIFAILAFALLCAGATSLRNFLARRLIWTGRR